jgi:hypothetical protein
MNQVELFITHNPVFNVELLPELEAYHIRWCDYLPDELSVGVHSGQAFNDVLC